MMRVIRTGLAIAGLIMSWRTYQSTRELEQRREHGDESVKDAVALTPAARLFDVPNGLSASGYFAMMAAVSVTGLADNRRVRPILLPLSWVSLGTSAYLIYQLFFVLKKNCPLCMRAHALNFALTVALTVPGAREARKR